jgi:hypothetical protein
MNVIEKIQKYRHQAHWGREYLSHSEHILGDQMTHMESTKLPYRFDVINYTIDYLNKSDLKYLEIGVRNPEDNFNKINASIKYSVDPGVEFINNPVDFKLTSDDFFKAIKNAEILDLNVKFDVIFIDGLHLADQVKRDIENSITYLSDNGFIFLHDCNPPTEYHARENFDYDLSPAKKSWNGTTWKSFIEFRKRSDYYSCCIDSDWGIGVITKSVNLGNSNQVENPFYEYFILNQHREECLNLISFQKFKDILLLSK